MKKEVFDVAVIGGGAAGLNASIGHAKLGKTVVLFEKHRVGGDCTHTGCVPSKTLISSAEQRPKQDWEQRMKRLKDTVQGIYEEEKPSVLESHGVQVVSEHAAFKSTNTLVAGDTEYEAKKIVVATGASPRTLKFPDAEIPIVTHEEIFDLQRQPRTLCIVGSGPISCELGQAFQRIGTQVHIVSKTPPLNVEGPKASQALKQRLLQEGMRIHEGTVEDVQGNEVLATNAAVKADAVLVAIGRVANTENLSLEKAGITVNEDGTIQTDTYYRASKNVYAVGDCASKHMFTHAADIHARNLVYNAANPFWKRKKSHPVIPRVTYTSPQIGSLGKTAKDLQTTRHATIHVSFSENDRARTENDTTGYIEVYATPLTGKILGAQIVGSQIDNIVSELTLAMQTNTSLYAVQRVVHPYPARSNIVRAAADKYVFEHVLPKLNWLSL